MVPSEALKNAYLNIEQTIRRVDKTGWETDVLGGVNYFFKVIDVSDLDIHDGDIVIAMPSNGGNDIDTLTMQAIKDGLVVLLLDNTTIYCESLVNPSTYQNDVAAIEIQITIFRCSTL